MGARPCVALRDVGWVTYASQVLLPPLMKGPDGQLVAGALPMSKHLSGHGSNPPLHPAGPAGG